MCSSDWGLVEEADNLSDSGSAGPLLTGDSSSPDIEEGEEESTGIFQLIDRLEDLTDRLINRYKVRSVFVKMIIRKRVTELVSLLGIFFSIPKQINHKIKSVPFCMLFILIFALNPDLEDTVEKITKIFFSYLSVTHKIANGN